MCPWMGFVVGLFLQFGGDLGVEGGGREAGVTEEELDGFEVHAVF